MLWKKIIFDVKFVGLNLNLWKTISVCLLPFCILVLEVDYSQFILTLSYTPADFHVLKLQARVEECVEEQGGSRQAEAN